MINYISLHIGICQILISLCHTIFIPKSMLYPLKFKPILKKAHWGGKRLAYKDKAIQQHEPIGESWEISGVQENISIVTEGILAENSLEELTEIYMGDLVGDKVFDKFGIEFPLLVKFLDMNDNLPLQVHPDDETAKERHRAYGKNKLWYIAEAESGSKITAGFKKSSNRSEFLQHLTQHTQAEILHIEPICKGDCFFLPSKTVHSLSGRCLVAEIQQTSDITYYLDDYNRNTIEGDKLNLDIELATDVINYNTIESRINYHRHKNHTEELIECPWFTVNYLNFNKEVEKDYIEQDSFVIYMCLSGNFNVVYNVDQTMNVTQSETILVPACLKDIFLIPQKESEILEIYIQ